VSYYSSFVCFIAISFLFFYTHFLFIISLFSKYTSTYYYSDGSDIYSTSYASCSGYSGAYITADTKWNSAGAYITADTKWNSAKAFSIIAVCIGGIAMIASCAAMGKPKLWMVVSMLLLITTLSQGLTFLFFSSNACVITAPLIDTQGTSSSAVSASFGDGCGLAAAAKLGITATVFWFFSALSAGVAGVGGNKAAAEEHNEVDVKKEYAFEQPEEAAKEEY
jgi:hypothetical protein